MTPSTDHPSTELEARLGFETLLADLSAQFIALPADEVDAGVLEAQRRICEALNLDTATLWQRSGDEQGGIVPTHCYSSQGGPPLPARGNPLELFPWHQRQMREGRLVAIRSLTELPPEAARDRENGARLGIRSALTLPLSVGGQPAFGALGFHSLRVEQDWPDELIKRLQRVARVFANALARKQAEDQLHQLTLAEEALRASEARSTAGAQLAGIGYYEVDFVRGTGFTDQRLHEICGLHPGSHSDLQFLQIWMDHVHADDRPRVLGERRKLREGPIQECSVVYRYLHPTQGQKWIHHLARIAERDDAGQTLRSFGVMRDVTAEKEAEAEMKRLRLQLWHADRVAQTGVITASLAHELNQPLTGILSAAQAGLRFMARGHPNPDDLREILTNIAQDTKRAGSIINGLRAMLRHKETQREPIHLQQVIHEVLDLLHSELIGRQVNFNLRHESAGPVMADKAQIQQVLLNLLMNALEAMQEQPPEQRRLQMTLARTPAGEALVSLHDSGPGIPEGRQEKVFEAFWTTKQQGLGIGLAVSRSIIESHGGRLWFENHPARGTTFAFSLPLASPPDPARREAGPIPPPATP